MSKVSISEGHIARDATKVEEGIEPKHKASIEGCVSFLTHQTIVALLSQ